MGVILIDGNNELVVDGGFDSLYMFDGDVDGIEEEEEEEDIKGRELLSSSEFVDVFLVVNVIASAIIIATSIKHTNEIIIL